MELCPVGEAERAGGAWERPPIEAGGESLGAEARLMRRVRGRWGRVVIEALAYSSVPREFLAALIANESGGDPAAVRFEPAVYRHLKAVAEGRRRAYGGVVRPALDAELADMLHPKAEAFHGAFLTEAFRAAHQAQLAAAEDEALRELATSWGLTQIMGYHMVGREGTTRDLRLPRFNLRMALVLLAHFAERYQLDLRREFPEMFRCWNTGQPYGETSDPAYVEKGLLRMRLYAQMAPQGEEDWEVSAA